jgi:amino acid adenylation domain-containing protein
MENRPTGVLSASAFAAPPRTLLDVLRDTSARHPEASALDDGLGALSYRELMAQVIATAARLHLAGVRRGDRVGIRMPSGTRELYISILGVIAAGAAYVPVDADDPEERAELVFGEARVRGIITGTGDFVPAAQEQVTTPPTPAALFADRPPHPSTSSTPIVDPPTPADDAWIIFTSGSTGTPKGVAVSHRSAAAFVDAEARLFLPAEPLGPGDRVLAGLSVAFDASCEEMWLAWGSGACLVPAPRSLVRSGMDLGPWLTARGITAVSTVPTLAALWPAESLENVRLLIFGGEACPPELAERLAVEGREVWNTYGPTEATVVACAAILDGSSPVRIGLPLDGWDLAVVDAAGLPVAEGEVGELIIGGVGLARYLDPAKDAEKYAPFPTLGWDRAYRSGDLVRFEERGLVFQGRADDQVKVGGRRIELGEIEATLQALPGVRGAAAAVRTTAAGNQVLVGYLAASPQFDRATAITRLREELPAALVPMLAIVDDLPTRTSGKVDRAALPWPLTSGDDGGTGADGADLSPLVAMLAGYWQDVLGVPITDPAANFFDLGGGSLAAAQLVARIRETDPEFTVADVYAHPRLGAMADALESRTSAAPTRESDHVVVPTPRKMQVLQTILGAPLYALSGIRWLVYLLTGTQILSWFPGFEALPVIPLGWLIAGLMVFASPAAAARGARGRLPPRRQRAPAPVAGRAGGPPGRRYQSRRRPVDHLLRAGPRREDRQRRRPAHVAAGDRDAHDRCGSIGRAGGRPVRLLDRRRRGAYRRDPHRRLRPYRRAQHPASRNPHRQTRRHCARLRRLRPGAVRPALGRLPRTARRQNQRLVARVPPTALDRLGGSVRRLLRRHVAAAHRLPRRGWPRGGRCNPRI